MSANASAIYANPVSPRPGCRILAVLPLYGLAEQMYHLLPHPCPPRPGIIYVAFICCGVVTGQVRTWHLAPHLVVCR